MIDRKRRLIAFGACGLFLLLAGCAGLGDFIVQTLTALGGAPTVEKRIAGTNYFELSHGDPKDGYSSQQGYICVVHNPGCGEIGNNGNDQFFTIRKQLPINAKIVGVQFIPIAPAGLPAYDSGGLFGDGSYGAKPQSGASDGSQPIVVSWKNSCQSVYRGINLYYQMSFIVSMTAGTDLGEPTFDPAATSAVPQCAPPGTASPPSTTAPSGFDGTVKYCNTTLVPTSGTLHIEATLVPPTVSGAQGATTMSETVPVTFPPSGTIPAVSQFKTSFMYQQGTWKITKAQLMVPSSTNLPGLPLTVMLPSAFSTPILDFSGGTCSV